HWNESLCQIGKDKTSDIVLQGFRVGKNHAFILQQDGDLFIKPGRDAKEIVVNGSKHAAYGPLKSSDKIQIGDYVIRITPTGKQGKTTIQAIPADTGQESPVA